MLQASEEAQSGREEVETLNEEFQATNEELETLNEELTASVEELRIANEDLGARTEELRLQSVALEEQKQTREEEHNRLESVLASLGDAVVAVDHAGRTVATNPAYDRLFGGPEARIKPEDLAGLPMPKADWPQQRAARGERFRMEFAVSDPDGSRRWFEAVTEPLTSQDRTWGGVIAIRDVSERTMRLSLERLMAAAGHELKTPTAALHNYLQLVDRHLADGRGRPGGDLRDPRAHPDATPGDAHRTPPRRQPHPEWTARAASRRRRSHRRRPIGGRGRPGPAQGSTHPGEGRGRSGDRARGCGAPGAGVPQSPGQRHGARAGLEDDRSHDRQLGRAWPRSRSAIADPGSRPTASGRSSMRTPGSGIRISRPASASACTSPGRSSRRTTARSRPPSRVGKGTVVTVRLPVAERRGAGGRARGRRAG